MRAVMVVFSYRYTGAAAVAEHCCRALRATGTDASLLYLGGDNLEERLRHTPWAAPALVKERRPKHLRANLSALREAAARADVMVSHLPHDHLLCVAAGVHRRCPLVHSFRNPRHLRHDPYHRALTRRLRGAILAHTGMQPLLARIRPGMPAMVLPVPLEDSFSPTLEPGRWRQRLGVPERSPTVGMVGKLAPDRGFDLLLETAAKITPPAHVIVVGHGEAQVELERLARRLGIVDLVHWAGYQEQELPGLLATMDVVLFTAAGSDHGHRAISEAQGCARPVVAADLPGVEDLIEDGSTGRIVGLDADTLAAAAADLLRDRATAARLGTAAAAAADRRRFEPSGRRLTEFLARISDQPRAARPDLT